MQLLKNQSNVVYAEKQINDYKDSIGELVESNDTRVRAIDKVILEKQEAADKKAASDKIIADKAAKVVAEAKAKEEANKKAVAKASTTSRTTVASKSTSTKTVAKTTTPKKTVAKTTTTPKKTTPAKTTTSSHGNVVHYSWNEDANGNKVPGTTTTFYQDGWAKGPDGTMYAPGSF